MSSEIKRELASADRIDLLVSFLKFSGWRLLRDDKLHCIAQIAPAVRVSVGETLGYEPPDKSLFEIFSSAKNTSGHGWFSAHGRQIREVYGQEPLGDQRRIQTQVVGIATGIAQENDFVNGFVCHRREAIFVHA